MIELTVKNKRFIDFLSTVFQKKDEPEYYIEGFCQTSLNVENGKARFIHNEYGSQLISDYDEG